MGRLVKSVSGGTPSREVPRFWNGDIPWLSAKDLKKFRLNDSIEKVTREGANNGTRLIEAGSILILVRGMTLLKDVPVGVTERTVAFNQDLKGLIPNRDVDGHYLGFYLAANRFRLLKLVDRASHGAGRLPSNLLQSFEVELPGIEEQRKIADILLTWDRAIESADNRVAAEGRLKRGLLERLLTGQKRLADFDGHKWESVRLGDVVIEEDAGTGSVRVRSRFSDLASLKLALPSLEEQRRIAVILNACDRELVLLQQQSDALKRQKLGLMQKLLARQIQVRMENSES